MIMEEPTEDPGGPEASGGASGRQREHSPMLHLDLYNFESAEAEGSRYVLTSPRSLEACARCLVKPVELLARSLSDLVKEAPGRSMRVATGLCEVYEIERQRKLKMCREERERIIRQEKRRILPLIISSSLGSPSTSKCPSRAELNSTTDPKRYESLPTTSHQRKSTPPSKDAHRTDTPPSKFHQKNKSPLTKGSKKHHAPAPKDQKNYPLLINRAESSESYTSKEPVRAVPPKNKSQSLDSLQRMRDGASARTSSESATSSYSGDSMKDKTAQFPQRPQTLDTVNSLLGRSFSLGDLSHSPQTTKKVEKMVKEVKKLGVQELPQRDKKIAALMIARHQEENIRNEQRYWAHLQWDTQRKTSELKKEQEDKERHKFLVQGHRRWESQIMNRHNRISLEELGSSSLTQSRSLVQLEKWRDKSLETEKHKKGKKEKARLDDEQKKTHEEQKLKSNDQKEKESFNQEEEILQQNMLAAQSKKQEKEQHMQKSLQNKTDKMKHQILLQEISQKEESENEELRKNMEKNLHRAQENVEHLLEKRNQELKNKARKEELQILRARQVAEKKERERREHLEELVRTAQRRLQHASQVAEEVVQHKAKKALEGRLEKEKIQRENRQKVQKNEDMKRQELVMSIEKKLERSEQIYKEKQTVLDNARSVARASFNIREKVRAETNTRTFDKMALEAELYASIDKN
ncbi:coiled-coil domain-containing protein 177 [Pelobates fuscus]|uniref:coiled-coil domain-containing protein 177 n=1 Tax=Pelobates fuscus TaxID=191477 RepID=UPI002FE4324F